MLRNLGIIVGACVLGSAAAILVQKPVRTDPPVVAESIIKPEEPSPAAPPAEERGVGTTSITMSELKELIGEDADTDAPSESPSPVPTAPQVRADSPAANTAFARTTVSNDGLAAEKRRVEEIRQKAKEKQLAAQEKVNARNARDSANPVDKAIRKSRISGNQVLLYFTAPDCTPCRRMEKEILGTPTGQLLTSRVEYCELNVENQGDVAGQFGVPGVPYLVLLDPQGKVLRSHGPFREDKDFQQWMMK